MTASITTSDAFQSVQLSFDSSSTLGISTVYARTDADTPVVVSITMRNGFPSSGSDAFDNLEVLQDIWASDDGFQDGDGTGITPTVFYYPFGSDVDALEEHGWWNPLHEGSYERWVDDQLIRGAHVREATYSEHATTGRPAVTSSIDDIPVFRNPGTETFDYSLSDWDISQFSATRLIFRLNFTQDDAVNSGNVDEQEGALAFIAWLNSIRVVGNEVTGSIRIFNSFDNRTFRFDQGGDADTVDMVINSTRQVFSGLYYSHIELGFDRASGDTDDFDIDAARTFFDTATGTITIDSDDAVEEPERGSTEVAHHASKIVFPGGLTLEPLDNRLTIKHETMGRFPLDGASVRSIRFADLETISSNANRKYVPNTGESVIHFGHTETADGVIRFRDIEDMLLADGSDLIVRVHNVSDDYDCDIQDN